MMMRKDNDSPRNIFSRSFVTLINILTSCSRQPTQWFTVDRSQSNKNNNNNNNKVVLSSPMMIRSNMCVSSTIRTDHHLKLSLASTFSSSIDQENDTTKTMPQIVVIDNTELSPAGSTGTTTANNDDRITRYESTTCHQHSVSGISSSSLSTSDCQSSLTIHRCYSTTTTVSPNPNHIPMLNENISPRSSSPPRLSYLIRPSIPCVFGTENYDDKPADEDEFFLTAGGIIHSCPNIYAYSLQIEQEHRQLQSCPHLILVDDPSITNHDIPNSYDMEFDRYSIVPRFQFPSSSSTSLSSDSINSEIELYKERHAIGLPRRPDDCLSNCSSFLPTTWKSHDYLWLMPLVHQPTLLPTISGNKRSRSFDMPMDQTRSSIVV